MFDLSFDGESLGDTSQAVTGADDLTSGRTVLVLLLQPPEPGEIEVEVWIVDDEGNESNSLSTTIVAE